MIRVSVLASAVSALFIGAAVMGDTVTIVPSKDNTLIEDAEGDVSNGLGTGIFAGRVNVIGGGLRRRGLIAFDVAGAVPEGATITAVTLTMKMNMTNAGDEEISLHRTLADWGEGTSAGFGGAGAPATPDSATWLNTFYPDEIWETEGGDFDPGASGSTIVGGFGFYTWDSTPGLVADAQAWLETPAENFGWVILGNENDIQTAKQFASREFDGSSEVPQLTIEFDIGGGIPGDLNGDGVVDAADLAILLAAWGPCPRCPEDLDGDGEVGASDLAILLANWG